MEIWIGEVTKDYEHISFYTGYSYVEEYKVTKTLLEEMKRSARGCVPAQTPTPIKYLPSVYRKKAGEKEELKDIKSLYNKYNGKYNAVCPYCWYNVKECKCYEYPDYIVGIDENILPHIRLLNYKGYKTAYCCEGHEKENMEASAYLLKKY